MLTFGLWSGDLYMFFAYLLIVQRGLPINASSLVAVQQNEGNHQTEKTLGFSKCEAKNSILEQLGFRIN